MGASEFHFPLAECTTALPAVFANLNFLSLGARTNVENGISRSPRSAHRSAPKQHRPARLLTTKTSKLKTIKLILYFNACITPNVLQ